MFNLFKKILAKKFTLELNQNEIEYKDKILNQINNLFGNACKDYPDGWGKLKSKLSTEIDEQILIARGLGKTPQELEQEQTDAINAGLDRKRKSINDGYSLSADDYQKVIVPIFGQIDFFPEINTITFSGDRVGDLLYFVSNNDYHISKEAQDKLMGFCDTYAVAEVAKAVRKTYEFVKRCESAEVSKIRLIAGRNCCDQCKSKDGTEISAKTILDEFNSGSISFPHSLPSDDTVNYCFGPSLLPLEI